MGICRFQVADKTIIVEIHYLEDVVPKDGKSSIFEFNAVTKGFPGVDVLFLDSELFPKTELVIRGLYHAFKDQIEHNISTSDNFALNALMHIFSTNQIDVIKHTVEPRSFNDSQKCIDKVAMILAGESIYESTFPEVLSAFQEKFLYKLGLAQNYQKNIDPKLLQAWTSFENEDGDIFRKLSSSVEWLIKLASARMALFSLNMQQRKI